MDQVSSHEGAEVPDEVGGVSLNDPAFWRELSSALGVANDRSSGLEAASEASSDFSDLSDGSDDDSGAASTSDESDLVSRDAPGVVEPSQHAMTNGLLNSHAKSLQQLSGTQKPATKSQQPAQYRQTGAATSNQVSPDTVLSQRVKPMSDASEPVSDVLQASHVEPNPGDQSSSVHSHQIPLASSAHGSCEGLHTGTAGSSFGYAGDLGAETATDSDDASDMDDDSFMQAYDQTLEQQLADSRVGNLLQPGLAKSAAQQSSGSGQANASASHAGKTKEEEAEELRPVDLDMNLVQNLLQSYAAQEGLAGPAGNLAGLLGLQLPHNAE